MAVARCNDYHYRKCDERNKHEGEYQYIADIKFIYCRGGNIRNLRSGAHAVEFNGIHDLVKQSKLLLAELAVMRLECYYNIRSVYDSIFLFAVNIGITGGIFHIEGKEQYIIICIY